MPNPHLVRNINPVDHYMQKQLLNDLIIIRPMLIVLLVFYHAFAVYGGAWTPIEGFPDIAAYWWLDRLAYAFMLEAFVFISGYVFGYQVRTKGLVVLQPKTFFCKKIKRLIVPCMVFSLLYILMFGNINQPISKTFYGMIGGTAHMWFLPMLFWCFVIIWGIEKLNAKPKMAFTLLFLCALCSFVTLPLQLSATLYYLPFFYIGYIIQRCHLSIEHFYTKRNTLISLLLFLVLFVILTPLWVNGISTESAIDASMLQKGCTLVLFRFIRLVCAITGLAFVFIATNTFLNNRHHRITPPHWLIQIGNLCFGVYLVQQFLLIGLYRHTSLPAIAGPYWLPWFGFIVALAGSLLIAFCLHNTRIGRWLIG